MDRWYKASSSIMYLGVNRLICTQGEGRRGSLKCVCLRNRVRGGQDQSVCIQIVNWLKSSCTIHCSLSKKQFRSWKSEKEVPIQRAAGVLRWKDASPSGVKIKQAKRLHIYQKKLSNNRHRAHGWEIRNGKKIIKGFGTCHEKSLIESF